MTKKTGLQQQATTITNSDDAEKQIQAEKGEELVNEADLLRQVKKAQQKGRKRARNIAKRERKFRQEKQKVAEAAAMRPAFTGGGSSSGGANLDRNIKIRDGISGRPIDRVVLVGGATRMPAIGRLLAALTGQVPLRTVNPDEAVALGCAVHVGVLDRGSLIDAAESDEAPGMTVLNPMQAAILRAVVKQRQEQGELTEDAGDGPFFLGDDEISDESFDTIEYF